MSRSNFSRRAWACGSALALVLMALAAGPAQAHHPRGLRDLAQRPLIGTAVNTDLLDSDPTYTAILDREFNSVTPENAMKWESVEAQRGVLDFSAADRLVAHARAHHQIVRGHTLVWHSQLPAWLTSGTFTNDELEAILHKHITDEVSHFRGRIYAWDVVNEAFNEDGTLRDTIWLRQLGPAYIAKAFRWAHQADPHAKLYYNDYNLEAIGPRATRRLRSSRACAARACRSTASASRAISGSSTPIPTRWARTSSASRRRASTSPSPRPTCACRSR